MSSREGESPQPPSFPTDPERAAGDSQNTPRPPPFFFAPFEGGPAVFIPGARDNVAARWDNAERRRVAAAEEKKKEEKKKRREERARRRAEEAAGEFPGEGGEHSHRRWRGFGCDTPLYANDQVPLLLDGDDSLAREVRSAGGLRVGGGGGDDGGGTASAVRRRRHRGKGVRWCDQEAATSEADGDGGRHHRGFGGGGGKGGEGGDERRTARLLEARVQRQRRRRLAQLAEAAAEAAAVVNAKACSSPPPTPTAAATASPSVAAAGAGLPAERMVIGVHLPTVLAKERARSAAAEAMKLAAEEGGGGDGVTPEPQQQQQQGLSKTEIALLLQCMCRADQAPDALTSLPPGTARRRRRRPSCDACSESPLDHESHRCGADALRPPSLFRRCTRALRRLWTTARRVSDASAEKLSDEEDGSGSDDSPLYMEDELFAPTADDLPLDGWTRASAYDADLELSGAEEDAGAAAEWVEEEEEEEERVIGGGVGGGAGDAARAVGEDAGHEEYHVEERIEDVVAMIEADGYVGDGSGDVDGLL